MKLCTSCKRYKPKISFSKHKIGKDGLHSCCKKCHSKKAMKWMAENKEKCRISNFKYQKNPLNKSKLQARIALRQAKNRGELTIPKLCQKCNKKKKLLADHFRGYSRKNWLNVQWICSTCDGILRGLRGETRWKNKMKK